MKRVFIGHRGAGKTSLLKRHQSYFPNVSHYDLDAEIEKSVQMSIADIFTQKGESAFREIEKSVFQNIVSQQQTYAIAVGGGFGTENLPEDTDIVFVNRSTDKEGRIFLNRPRLESNLSFLDEYKKRYELRHTRFLKEASRVYHLPEGLDFESEAEKCIFTENYLVDGAYYTLHQQDIKRLDKLVLNFKQIELRTDLLSSSLIEEILAKYPQNYFLVAIRNHNKIKLPSQQLVDCDYLYLNMECQIMSSHSDSIQTGIKQLEEFSATHELKLCPLVKDFEELKAGYEWQQKDPQRRSFLPRSLNGQWFWYRQWARYNQKLNFVRGFADIYDQPTVIEWLQMPEVAPSYWAAVLGSPVYFSRSPQQHKNFFRERSTYFSKVDIRPEDLIAHFKFLTKLGLRMAAVTSPLKEQIFNLSEKQTEAAKKFKAANTVVLSGDSLLVHNTDVDGFKVLIAGLTTSDQTAIWGGGGTLEMMKSFVPAASLFSSQTGELRETTVTNEGITEFDYLVWAAPRSHKTLMPPNKIKVKQVIDLNYAENSMGLEFAAERKIGYTSGLRMFTAQAEEQQKFWAANEELK